MTNILFTVAKYVTWGKLGHYRKKRTVHNNHASCLMDYAEHFIY